MMPIDPDTLGFLPFGNGSKRRAGASANGASILLKEPRNLWPSGRGTEIAHIRCDFDKLADALAQRERVALFRTKGSSAIILRKLAGQRAVTLVEEAAIAPGILSVIADAASDRFPILRDLQILLNGVAVVEPSAPDMPA